MCRVVAPASACTLFLMQMSITVQSFIILASMMSEISRFWWFLAYFILIYKMYHWREYNWAVCLFYSNLIKLSKNVKDLLRTKKSYGTEFCDNADHTILNWDREIWLNFKLIFLFINWLSGGNTWLRLLKYIKSQIWKIAIHRWKELSVLRDPKDTQLILYFHTSILDYKFENDFVAYDAGYHDWKVLTL